MKVIEFFGMPRAGKTTALEVMESYFKKNGARVRAVYEGARISPLDKSDRFNYNAWSFHNTINRILEARLDHYDFILVDRGILDHMAFLVAIQPYCAKSKSSLYTTFDYYKDFLKLQDKEIFFTAEPETVIRRERKHKPIVGRVFEMDFLNRLKDAYDDVLTHKTRNIDEIDGNKSFEHNLNQILDFSKKLLKGGN